MRIRESILAVAGALAAGLVAQLVLLAALAAVRPLLMSSTWVADHPAVMNTIAYTVGFLVVATSAGFVLGRLLPNHPIGHVMAVGLVSPIIGYLLAGPTALAHGWQIAGYAGQLGVIGLIAILVFNRRQTIHPGLPRAA